jgi:hypothetical protein
METVKKIAGQILIVAGGVALFHLAVKPLFDKAKTMLPASKA